MNQEELTAILSNLPTWATEETLDSLNSASAQNNSILAQIAGTLGTSSVADVGVLNRKADNLSEDADSTGKKIIKGARAAQNTLNKMINNSDPVNAVAELSHEAAKLLANAGIGLAKFTSGIKGVGAAVNVAQKVAGTGLVIGTGMAVIFAKLLTEQEKQTRQFVEFGSLVADQALWTSLRSSTRSLGMGLKDYTEMADGAKPFLLSAEGDVFKGQLSLSEFIDNIDQDKTFADFGLSVQDQSRFITQETETLFQAGQITEINAMTKRKVMDGFKSANKLAMFTGNTLGIQRTEALALREEARNNVDLQTALIQNAQTITDQYGEVAAKNILDASGYMNTLNASTFGKDWSQSFQDHVAGTIGDIKYDNQAINNIDTATLAKLRAVGPGVAEAYIELVQDVATGKIETEAEAVIRQRDFTKLVRDQTAKISAFNPLLADANVLIAEAKLIPDSYFKADVKELESDTLYVIDDMSVTFQQIQEIITPSYKTTSVGFKALSGTMMNFGKGLSKLFGKEAEERFDQMYQISKTEANTARLSQVTGDNIDSNIQMIAMHIDSVKSGQAELQEYTTGGVNSETGDAFSEEELFALEAQKDQLVDQMLELKEYQSMLLEKEAELTMAEIGI